MSSRQRRFGYCLAAFGVIFIFLLTLFPQPSEVAKVAATPLTCLVCGDVGGVDTFLNLLLFVPLGLGLGLAGFSWRRALALSFLLSLCIELLQLVAIVGRDASLGDVLTNTTGGSIGALLGVHWRRLVHASRSDARRLALGWAATLLGIWAVSAWTLGPTYPVGSPWYGQWAADLGYMAPFRGTPLEVSAGGIPLPPGRALDQPRLKAAVESNPEMTVRAVLALPPHRFAPIGSIMDAEHREVIFLGQERQDLGFRLRMRATVLKLRVPTVNLRNGMAGQPGDTVDAEAALRGGAFELRSRIGGVIRTRTLPLSASWGWSLVTPWSSVLGEEVNELTAVWIFGLIALLAYWSASAGGSSLVLIPATIFVILVVVPWAAKFQAAHWTEWAGAFAGSVAGWALADLRPRFIANRSDPGLDAEQAKQSSSAKKLGRK